MVKLEEHIVKINNIKMQADKSEGRKKKQLLKCYHRLCKELLQCYIYTEGNEIDHIERIKG